MKTKGTLAERAIWWAGEFTKALMDWPELREQIPEHATVVILPDEDPELASYNVSLVYKAEGEVIFVRFKKSASGYTIEPFYPQQNYHYSP
ncbi:MAG: hypothetical protein M3511_08765 [Deinococcota bacterium]|jgi:hypothetical protein|nr:hypothetical protein [Deinococcota bacterium]